MRTNLFFLFSFIFAASIAHAQVNRSDFKDVPKGKQMDLLQEGNTLSLNQEASIQKAPQSSKMYATFMAGLFQPTSLTAASNGHTMNYNFDHLLPIATFQFNHYLWQKAYGKLGWAGSLGYSYSQYQDTAATALHIIPLNLNAAYRIEFKDTQKFIPYVMAGPSLWTYFQRGADAYNTSQSTLFGSATAGVAINLNRLHILTSENESEVVLQYQRTMGPSGGSMDFNGNSFQLGGTIAL